MLCGFAIVFYGFFVVAREYRHISSWAQMKEYIQLTQNGDLSADIVKGTIGLSRTRPGLLMIGIGSVLLGILLFKDVTVTSTTESGVLPLVTPAAVGSTTESGSKINPKGPLNASSKNNKSPNRDSIGSTNKIAHAVKKKQPKPNQCSLNTTLGTWKKRTTRTQFERAPSTLLGKQSGTGGAVTDQSSATKNQGLPPIHGSQSKATATLSEFSPEALLRFRERILDLWLRDVQHLEGKSLAEQIRELQSRHGEAFASPNRLVVQNGDTLNSVVNELYGDEKYEPLILAFNPWITNRGQKFSAGQVIVSLQPLSGAVQSGYFRVSKTVKISGADARTGPQDYLLEIAENALKLESFKQKPGQFWSTADRGLLEFSKALSDSTGVTWVVQPYVTEEGESLISVTKTVYGSSRYLPILYFTNPEMGAQSPTSGLKAKTELVLLRLIGI